ncbi:obscurin-like protein 1 isoform X7 [Megalobrama amblycephala]|uniref:obscurin-like protein 1 isoform X7 n=1 Tax=Megalobrama amblycephala TaxID=75352 RepID=UPI002013C907|nr:obscurin-like protein 1 isoform X7 [Megalobrama amblycephala]
MDVFGGAPRFLAYPRPVVVQSGTDAVLKCQISGDPRPAVIWERNNEKIHPEGRYRVFEDGNVYNLIITSVTMEDSGQYICKAKNCIGETYAAATLKVEGEAQEMEFREENKPRFLIKPLSTRVGRGEDAVFSCKLWGNPRPEVMWEKDGKKLNEIFESTHFTISYQDGGWFQLKIFKTRAPDGGVYTCKARNEFGESLAGAVLLVDAGPGHEDEGNRNGYTNAHWKAHQGKQRSGRQVATRLKDDPLPNSAKVKMFAVTEGKHAKFRCYVTGKPKPEILWRKDGRLILSGRRYLLYEDREGYFTLKVLYCKQQDNGVYVCSASNTAGQTLSAVHLIVKEPPVRFKQPLNDLQVWERDLAVLECEVPEDSVPITWYLEDRRLQPGAKYGMEEWGTKRRLTIRDIGVDDDGIYLCEMADGGRSIAEVAVKGTIVRKLPRKVDVLEGENAAFCVEVEEEEMDIHWYKDGTELRETHQTILKSFGRTHILVFVNTTPQDSGLVMFYVGRSKTSSQLRVKAARHCPPSCPIGVQINTERANAALLSWFPAQDSRKNPPSGYIIERQEVGSQEWLQCLTTDSATSVEILGDSVPCEADYRFRICSVNKYGRSGNVEFPRAVHLVPVARIQAPLQDALVPEGQDACFTIELSASVIGTWFLNGNQLQDDERFSIRRSRTHQSLRIRGVRDTDNGAEITFIAYGIRDSAALYIQAPLVKFTPLSEMDRNKFVEVGNPIVLYCELSDPEAPVRWYKNGVELQSMEGLHIQSEGTMRRIVIQSAEFSHSGVYSCDAIDDVIRFNVEVEAPPVRFSVLPEGERNKSIEVGSTIALQCEVSDPLAYVSWYKDGAKLLPQSGLDFKSEGTKRELFVQSAEFYHSGVYSCKTRGDAVHFNVDVKAPPVRFSAVPEVKRRKCIEAGCPIILQCEISDSTAQVQWYKDGDQLLVESGVDIKSDDCMRTLSIQSAHPSHAGVYSCTTKDDVIKFHVEIRAAPVRFSAVPEAEKNICTEAGGHFELHCKVSDPTVHVRWFHNNTQLQPETGLDIQSEGDSRTLVVNPAEPSHSGLYRCETSDDSVQFTVDIKDPPVMFSTLPDTVKNQLVEADYSTDMHGEISDPNAKVCCYKDGVELVSKSQPHIKLECTRRTLAVKTAQPSNSGWYDCVKTGDVIQFNVQDQVPPPTCLADPDVEMTKCTEEMEPAALHYEISDPTPYVRQTKDEEVMLPQSEPAAEFEPELELESKSEFEPESEPEVHSDASRGTLIIHSPETSLFEVNSPKTPDDPIQFEMDQAELSHYEVFSGETYDDSVQCTVDIKEEFLRRSGTEAEIRSEKENNKLTAERSGEGTPVSIPTTFRLTKEEPQLQPILQPQLKGMPELRQHLEPMLQPQLQGMPELQPHLESMLQPQLQGMPELQPQLQGMPELQPQLEPMLQPMLQPQIQGMPELQPQLEPMLQPQIQGMSELQPQIQGMPELQPQLEPMLQPQIQGMSELQPQIQGMPELQPQLEQMVQPMLQPQLQGMPELQPQLEPMLQPMLQPQIQGMPELQPQLEPMLQPMLQPQIQGMPELQSQLEPMLQPILQPQLQGMPELQPQLEPMLQPQVQPQLQQLQPQLQPMNQTRTSISEDEGSNHITIQESDMDQDVLAFKVDVEASTTNSTSLCGMDESLPIDADCSSALLIESSDHTTQEKPISCQQDEATMIFNKPAIQKELIQSSNMCLQEAYETVTKEEFVYQKELKEPVHNEELFTQPLESEVSRRIEGDSPVCWYEDGMQFYSENGHVLEMEEGVQRLNAPATDSGQSKDDDIIFKVDVKATSLQTSTIRETEGSESNDETGIAFPQSEVSSTMAEVCRYKEGEDLQQCDVITQSEETFRALVAKTAEPSHSGEHACETDDVTVQFAVDLPAPPVTFSSVPEAQRTKCIESGRPFKLQCEVSDPDAEVCWYKDGNEVLPQDGIVTVNEQAMRTLSVQTAELRHSGTYSCQTNNDTITFHVEIKAPSLKFIPISEVEKNKSTEVDSPIVLKCELSEASAQVLWCKDGRELAPNPGLNFQSDGNMRKLTVQSAKLSDTGNYTCHVPGDTVSFNVDVQAHPVRFSALPEIARNKFIEAGCPIILQCEISDPTAQVSWLKDGVELQQDSGLDIQSEGTMKTMIIHSAELKHSGVYSCEAVDDRIAFKVDVAAPPVTFDYIPEDDLHRNIVEQDNLLLCCQVSRSDATAQWYKDGVELKSSDNVLIEAENTLRRLIILSAQLSDSGTYTCRAGDNALIFKVNVREPPVMIVYPKEDVHLDRYVPEEIVLSCELSRPNGKVTWFKDGQKLQESENIKLKTEGPYRRLKILRSGVEDSGEYVCDTADDSIFFNLNIKEPPVRIVSPSQSQMELCQQTSERMVLSCEISRPNATVRWYRDGLEVEESDSLILEVDGVYRRLIIPKPTVKDSAEYVCDTADDSVTFFVNIAEPPVRFIRPRKTTYAIEKLVGEIVVLECEVSRPNAEVSWKKDGEEIEENINITITEDGTSRQLTIHSAALDDAGQYVCDARDDVMDFLVKIKDPPLKIMRKADIETKRQFVVSDAIVLKCEISRANGVVSWLKDNEKIEGKDHFICEEEGTFRSLIVLSAELMDSGEYICDAQDDKVVFTVTVEEAPVSIVGNSEKPEHHILMTGDELILECEVSRVNAIVQWYRNGSLLQEDSRTHIESRDTMRKLVISGLQTSDSGEYLCDAIDDKMITRLTVQEPPFKFIKKEERTNISAYEEDSVTLHATVNRVNAPVKWQKDHNPIRGDRFHTTSDGSTHYLTINPLKRCDTGEYTCHVGSDEMHFSVHVKAMKVKFSKPLENIAGLKGSDVVLKCELYKSKGDVQWLKDSQEIVPNRHFTIRADGRVRSLTIHNVTEDDAGEYACESKDERTSAAVVVNIPRIVEFIAELHNITVMEGEDATFKCVVSPEDAKLAWFRNGQLISSNDKFNISSNGLCHILHINNCQVSDSCKLTAKAEGVISRAILQVQEAQVLFTKSMDPVVAEEFGEATLEVEVSLETAEVQWMRQGVVIHPGSKFTLKQSGKKRSLTIHKLTLSDRGTYSCETLHDRTQAKLSVEPRKIKIRKGLTEIQTYERETASFEVELSHSNVEGVWQKDGHALKNNNRLRMTAKGRVHSLTISSLTLDDTGTYIFSVENVRSLARLDVKEIPVTILKKLEDIRQSEGSGITLECELSRHNIDIKWTKNEVQLKPGKNHRIYSMGRKCFLHILKCELGDSGLYACDAGEAKTSCSVEIYERELEILQSLEDLDIQEDQNAVFMCEVSLDDEPGEWFKNGEKIKPTSTIKIRQEGTKHFLLICNVKGDDSGEIKFVSKNVETTAYLEVEALPANIAKPLQDKTALEKTRVILDCTVTNPRCSIRWYKGPNVILPSERFEICSEGCYRKLVIQQVLLEDEGTYSVQVGNYTSSAKLTVEAQSILMVRELQDVDVTAPADACFECEVSLPVVKAPSWTLKGETLHPGPKVVLEKMGTVHRLTLKQTSADMSGIVCFITGRVKSTAHLRVISNH